MKLEDNKNHAENYMQLAYIKLVLLFAINLLRFNTNCPQHAMIYTAHNPLIFLAVQYK